MENLEQPFYATASSAFPSQLRCNHQHTMSRYDGPSTRAHPNNDGFRVVKKGAKLKVKKGGGPDQWSQKGKGAVKNANASITPLKRRLRSLGRLLSNNEKLPADVKIGHEREIQAIKHELVGIMLDKEKHDMIGRYHKVRFFERQKATRHFKKASKALEACEDESARPALKMKAHIAEVDLNYPQYYPYMTAYQSMWKKEKGEGNEDKYTPNNEQEDGAKGNVEIWRQVEEAMEKGTLDRLKDIVDDARMEKIRRDVDAHCKISSGTAAIKDKAMNDEEAQEDDTGAGFFE